MSHTDHVSRPDVLTSVASAAQLQAELQSLQGQLRAAEATAQQARRLFIHAPQGAFLLTSEGRVLEANLQAGVVLGRPAHLLTGRRLGPLLSPASQHTLTTLLKRVFDTAERVEEELLVLLPDGGTQSVLVAASLSDGSEETPWCHLVVTNVTPLKEGHLFLLNETERLERQIQEHEVRNRRLDEEVHGVVSATHTQLHLHLSRLQGYLKLHQKEMRPNGRPAPHLETVQEVLGTTFGLLEALDQYVQARQLRLRLSPVDLNRVLAEVRKDLRGALSGREVQLSAPHLPTVLGDSKALQIILQEYLLNALKFTRTRDVTRLQLRIEEVDGAYLLGVTDNGLGFNMRQKDKAFDLFGRLHPTAACEGTGLGLAVVRRLAERMGGRAWGEGKVNQGATFWVSCLKVPGVLA
ncbi:PAS domain-containing protein [Deinococcus sp. HMF7604]|uniref:sensor histidine kinase n=1 Tax=Deinococcus betulae TaxID=2873312 RepID=UPI001CCBC774|nr:ATP-binding protein [Deinococcus betulae]MBZ9750672.1 PAS domain-containing protein [Deinococcus betulae]